MKKSETSRVRVNLTLDATTHRAVKVAAAAQGTTVQAFVEVAIKKALGASHGRPKGER